MHSICNISVNDGVQEGVDKGFKNGYLNLQSHALKYLFHINDMK